MAKRVHSLSLEGKFSHEIGLSEEAVKNIDTKETMILYYKLYDLLKEFDGKQVSITIKEEDEIEAADAAG
ncbi:YonK family protein [Brevibacillus daliensis]|uniref:YonK family protein n=1 Tax=Brevibacillus daliensis TaxID=2892995 RepID=UPI001E5D9A81|nr:YonK family protein [Brevibacillus daliensis]